MSDLIERSAVLDLMRTNWADNDGDTAMQLSIDDVRDLYFDSSWATCSECKECARQKTENDGWGFSISFLKYCPNCGAKMEGEEDADID